MTQHQGETFKRLSKLPLKKATVEIEVRFEQAFSTTLVIDIGFGTVQGQHCSDLVLFWTTYFLASITGESGKAG